MPLRLGRPSTATGVEASLRLASTSKGAEASLGQASTSNEDEAFLGQASTSKEDRAFLGQASTSKEDGAFLGQASTSQRAEAFVVQASTSRGVDQSTGPLIVVIPAELTSAESVPTGEEVPVVGGSSLGVTSSAPVDGDEKTGGESGGGSGTGKPHFL